jgi:hypothetical protein
MKQFLFLMMVAFLAVGCGSSSPSTPAPSGPVAPQPGGTYGKWDAQTAEAFKQACSQAGQGFSQQQWYQYCDCIGQWASAQWDFDTFAYYIDQIYYTYIIAPGANGAPSPDTTCLQRAGMLNGTTRSQTYGQISSVSYL